MNATWVESKKHMWKKHPSGKVDTMAWDYEFHNGPSCVLCYYSPCEHCTPDWEDHEDCDELHYECSACGEMTVDKKPECPNCGAKMDNKEKTGD